MTVKEEQWVNALIATLMARPTMPKEIDTSEKSEAEIRAHERERVANSIADSIENFGFANWTPAEMAAWVRKHQS